MKNSWQFSVFSFQFSVRGLAENCKLKTGYFARSLLFSRAPVGSERPWPPSLNWPRSPAPIARSSGLYPVRPFTGRTRSTSP
jgi:hypothetical protein